MRYSPFEFIVSLEESMAPSPYVEYYCLNAPACSYGPASRTFCPQAEFANYTDFQSNTGLLDDDCNYVKLVDASALYGGGTCTGECSGLLVRHNVVGSGATQAACPIGTEMVLIVEGEKEEVPSVRSGYWFMFDSRTNFVDGSLPPGCFKVQSKVHCKSGRLEMHFSYIEPGKFCNATDEANPCAIPESGYPFGTCASFPSACKGGLN